MREHKFPAGTVPSRPGLYKRSHPGDRYSAYQYWAVWTGVCWNGFSNLKSLAVASRCESSAGPEEMDWIGLVEEE